MANVQRSRRSFVRGLLSGRTDSIRPPWAARERLFVERCSRCDRCVDACPNAILARGDGGFPTVDFARGECTFCGACAESCKTGALKADGPRSEASPWNARVEIASNCLSMNGVTCRVCGDRCESRAIAFRLVVGGRAFPMVSDDACTGCGACVPSCPIGSIAVLVAGETPKPRSEERRDAHHQI